METGQNEIITNPPEFSRSIHNRRTTTIVQNLNLNKNKFLDSIKFSHQSKETCLNDNEDQGEEAIKVNSEGKNFVSRGAKKKLSLIVQKTRFDEEEIKIKTKDIKLENILEIIKKPISQRNELDVIVLSRFIEKSKLGVYLDSLIEPNIHGNILYLLSRFFKYVKLDKNQTLFEEGEIGDKFYFIFEGSVRVVKITENHKSMTPEQYIEHVEKTKDNKNLLERTLKENNSTYFLDYHHVAELPEIRLLLAIRGNIEYAKNVIETVKLIERSKLLDSKKLETLKTTPIDKLPDLKFKFIHEINKKIENLGLPFLIENSCEKIKIYDFTEMDVIGKGNYFGDLSLDRLNNCRTSTIIGNEYCHLGYIEKNEYKQFISNIKKEIEKDICESIINDFFFSSLNIKSFYLNYFHLLTYNEKSKGDSLFKENDELQYIYFIKEGEIKYIYKEDLNELNLKVKELTRRFNMKNEYGIYDESHFYFKKYEESLSKRKVLNVYTSGPDHTIGLDEYFFEIKKFLEAVVTSKNLKYFTISLKNFQILLQTEPKLAKAFEKSTLTKIKGLVGRLIDLRNSKFDSLAKKIEPKLEEITDKWAERGNPNARERIVKKISTSINAPQVQITEFTVDENTRPSFFPPITNRKSKSNRFLSVNQIHLEQNTFDGNIERKKSSVELSQNGIFSLREALRRNTPVKILNTENKLNKQQKNQNLYSFVSQSKNNVGVNLIVNNNYGKEFEKNLVSKQANRTSKSTKHIINLLNMKKGTIFETPLRNSEMTEKNKNQSRLYLKEHSNLKKLID